MEGWLVNNELERMWPHFMKYPGIFLEGLKNIRKNLSEVSQSLG
jgi:hypothetical protein